MPRTIIKYAGVQRNSLRIFKKDGGIQRNIKRIYRKHLGVWQLVFGGSGNITYSTPGTYTFIPQPGTTSITVSLVGGSGGGGYSGSYSNGIYAVGDGAWGSLMNSFAVWGGGQDYTRSVNFPVSGNYTFNYAVDNYGTMYLDGAPIISLGGTVASNFTTTHTQVVYVTAGIHSVRVNGINTGGPGGIAGQILKPDTTSLWNTRSLIITGGVAGYGGGGGGATNVVTGTYPVVAGTEYTVVVGAGGALQNPGTPSSIVGIVATGSGGAGVFAAGGIGANGGGNGQPGGAPTTTTSGGSKTSNTYQGSTKGGSLSTTTTTVVPGANGAGGIAGPGGRNGGAGMAVGLAGYVTITW